MILSWKNLRIGQVIDYLRGGCGRDSHIFDGIFTSISDLLNLVPLSRTLEASYPLYNDFDFSSLSL